MTGRSQDLDGSLPLHDCGIVASSSATERRGRRRLRGFVVADAARDAFLDGDKDGRGHNILLLSACWSCLDELCSLMGSK